MEHDDDWVSASPIKLGTLSASQAFTPGRVLSRKEVRQQRRRGGPAIISQTESQEPETLKDAQATTTTKSVVMRQIITETS